MSKNILKRVLVTFALLLTTLTAQDKVDAIEAARQAKAAAEKATAAAEAATDAAINQAASQAADNARAKMKQGKLDKEARIAAEIAAAEEAELDAAASAAAEEAKRKMAQELGLEYEDPSNTEEGSLVATDSTDLEEVEEVVARESLGFNLGVTGSVGFLNGKFITNTPNGASLVLTTPYGFSLGEYMDLTVSLFVGGYNPKGNADIALESIAYGVGLNSTLFDMVFSETHVGMVTSGIGVRNFSGVSLEKLMSNSLGLPFNILLGAETFITTKASDDPDYDLSSYWSGLGLRLDYSF